MTAITLTLVLTGTMTRYDPGVMETAVHNHVALGHYPLTRPAETYITLMDCSLLGRPAAILWPSGSRTLHRVGDCHNRTTPALRGHAVEVSYRVAEQHSRPQGRFLLPLDGHLPGVQVTVWSHRSGRVAGTERVPSATPVRRRRSPSLQDRVSRARMEEPWSHRSRRVAGTGLRGVTGKAGRPLRSGPGGPSLARMEEPWSLFGAGFAARRAAGRPQITGALTARRQARKENKHATAKQNTNTQDGNPVPRRRFPSVRKSRSRPQTTRTHNRLHPTPGTHDHCMPLPTTRTRAQGQGQDHNNTPTPPTGTALCRLPRDLAPSISCEPASGIIHNRRSTRGRLHRLLIHS